MRKIFSIVITLGLVLGLSLIAMPAAAWECEAAIPVADVVVVPDCACTEAAYNISFNTTASLTEGLNIVCIQFPAGTTVPTEFDEETVFIGNTGNPHVAVFPEEITVTGTKVCFIVPETFDALSEILVEFTIDAGLENPCTPDDYVLTVWTDRAPDATPIEGEYEIVPETSVYAFSFDFGATYPGIKKGFVPPFKACGQNDTTPEAIEAGFNTTEIDGHFYDQFALYFLAAIEGCEVPCVNATVWFELTSIPEYEEMHLWLNSVNYTLDVCNITKTVGKFDASTDWKIDAALPLTTDLLTGWAGLLHFSSPGTYTIGLYAECPKTTCNPGGIIASKVQSFVAHQDKDAAKMILEEKWNLISLPLHPFDTSISSLMAAWDLNLVAPLKGVSELVSIHYFDQCTDTWYVYGNGQTSLSTMEAGKSYWVRMVYPAPSYTLWVFGTARPMPPDAPAVYTMCAGWNMFGFTSLLPDNAGDAGVGYLWNFGTMTNPDPLVYTWFNSGTWTTSGWKLLKVSTVADLMNVGEGFWGYFPSGGVIVP